MTVRLILAGLSFCVAMYGCYAANRAYYKMIEEINKARRDDDQIDPYAFSLWRRVAIFDALSEYRFHYPSGRLHLRMIRAGAMSAIAMLGAAICLGIIPV